MEKFSAKDFTDLAASLDKMVEPFRGEPSIVLAEARSQIVYLLLRASRLAKESASWMEKREESQTAEREP